VLATTTVNGLGTGPVSLEGGTLNLNFNYTGVSGSANEVVNNVQLIRFGPGEGYNVTVSALNSLGTANTTSQLGSTMSAGVFAAINNLTVQAPVLNIGATTAGVAVLGSTVLSGDTTLNLTGGMYLSGRVSGASAAPVVTKLGAGTLWLANSLAGATPNAVAEWRVLGGTLEARMTLNGVNPIGAAPVVLNGGTFNLRHDADNTADVQILSDFAGTDIVVGTTTGLGGGGVGDGECGVDVEH
jgi:hypothetical protein